MSGTGRARSDPANTATERTLLAWRRTALSGTAVTLLVVRLAVRDGYGPVHLSLAALALPGLFGLLLLTRYRLRALTRPEAPSGWVPVATAACAAWFAVIGVGLAVLP
jgi:uncharacterized membrane protein YidH (DUF202 family)